MNFESCISAAPETSSTRMGGGRRDEKHSGWCGPSRFRPEGASLSTSTGVPGNSLGTTEVQPTSMANSDANLSISNGLNGSAGHYRDPDDFLSNSDVNQASQIGLLESSADFLAQIDPVVELRQGPPAPTQLKKVITSAQRAELWLRESHRMTFPKVGATEPRRDLMTG